MSGVLVLLVVHMGVASPCGQFYLPDKEFRWICYLQTWRVHYFSTGGSVISADLPTSPQGPDHLFVSRSQERVGVWSLRILKNCEGFRWFIVSEMAAISARPSTERCLPASIISMIDANL